MSSGWFMQSADTPAPTDSGRKPAGPPSLLGGILVSSTCLLLAFFLVGLAVTMVFKSADRNLADKTLAAYLRRYRRGGLAALQQGFPHLSGHRASFLRLTGPRLRLILLSADTGTNRTSTPDFDSFAPDLRATWTALNSSASGNTWAVASTRTGDGNILQIGIDCAGTVALLDRARMTIIALAFALLPLAAAGPLYMHFLRKGDMRRIISVIEEAASGGTAPPLSATGSTAEEQDLAAAVNHLMKRHTSLARELQESMDNVAHDLRTPMTRLRAAAEYGLQTGSAEQLRESLADCLEESDRVLAMLNTMLTVAEAQADTVALNLEAVDLRDIIAQVVDMYQLLAEEHHVRLEINTPEAVLARVDKTRIGQVWANLLDNAIKYGATRITISLACRQGMAEGRIEDNGMGISAAESKRIWERLYRGDRSRNRPGLGLGLTLVRALVKAHHGTVEVRSRLNQGTTFIVRLPLA